MSTETARGMGKGTAVGVILGLASLIPLSILAGKNEPAKRAEYQTYVDATKTLSSLCLYRDSSNSFVFQIPYKTEAINENLKLILSPDKDKINKLEETIALVNAYIINIKS